MTRPGLARARVGVRGAQEEAGRAACSAHGLDTPDPGVDPAGWESNKGYNRAHLLGAQIGGSNKDPRNFVTMHAYANSPIMRRYEGQLRKAVDNGEVIEYSATPVYKGDSVIPEGVWLEAQGSDGFQFMPKGATTGTNRIYIPNEPRN
ncbi:DNA/RNA non-specific endonuclease [Streptomyces sp. NPDC102274]|uniref:DNA/RNA non-specific endonuclease n=1 Tax=Streptomyces sp. NPDC102274 TaxID=3366151 RepID=UPI00382C6BD9